MSGRQTIVAKQSCWREQLHTLRASRMSQQPDKQIVEVLTMNA